jgi:hypothetical protein
MIIIGEYATKRCFFRFEKADHRYWKLINYALTWARPNLLLSLFMQVEEMDAILLIIGIVYGVCRIVIKSVQQCILFSVNLFLVGVYYG